MNTCPRITKPTDLRAPGAIDQLIAFHRQTFGGWNMGPEEDAAAAAAATAAAAEKTAAEKAVADKAAADKAAADKAAAEKAGFPADTPVSEMTDKEAAAYYKDKARKHEDRNKEWQDTLGGKTAAEIKAERDELVKLREAGLSDAEKAVEDAKKTGKAESDAQWGSKLVAAKFETALAHLDDDRIETIVDTLDLTKFLNDNGDVDTDKVKSTAAALAPADTGAGENKKQDFGGGRRQSGTSTGVNSGRSRYQERHAKKADA